ncbi:hypothetical protein ABPG72_008826 [Tetrahymena utriculariae]
MNQQIFLIILLINVAKRVICYQNNQTSIYIDSDQSLKFYRAFIYEGDCEQIRSFNSDYINITNQLYEQNQPIFWNSNGIQSDNSFSQYQIENNILSIKVYNILLKLCAEIQISQRRNEEIQYFGDDKALIFSKFTTYIFNNNILDQTLPNTDVYLFNFFLEVSQVQIIDLSESFRSLQDLPKFDKNYQYQNGLYFLMSYKDFNSENSQKVLFIYQIILNYSNFAKEFVKQNNEQIIYLSNSQSKLFVKYVDEQNNNFDYQQFTLGQRNNYMKKETNLIKVKVLQPVTYLRDFLGSGSYGDVYKVKNKHKDIIKNQDILSTKTDYYASVPCMRQKSQKNQKYYDNVVKLQNYLVENRSTYIILDLTESTLQEYSQIILLITKMLDFNPDHRPDSSILIQTIEEIKYQLKINE